ncbi:MAG TPA: carotenoid oxygenase family protein [Stellaceae bacterium]|nr:carotenoid oxygenase family protein [Stellaceae bacterium]
MSQPFPDDPFFTGNFAPITFEAEAPDLVVRGALPKDLTGTLYRIGPNPQFAPRDANFHWFIGDGMVHAFHLENGRVAYRNRWVRTPKWQLEHDAHKALFGSWGNPMTSDPSVVGKNGGVANTNIVWHAGKLLALVESNLPFAVDPETLAPEGYDDFAGALAGGKVTAHPKLDPETGEMVFFAYSAGAFFSKTMLYGVIDKTGKLTRLDKFEAPFSAMVHDFLVTRNYVLFPILPLTGSLERVMSGKPAFAWEPGKGAHVGVMKRDAAVSTIRWFQCDPCYVFHPMNAYEDGNKIVADVMQYPEAPLFPSPDGKPGDPEKAVARLTRWTFDLDANTDSFKREQIDDLSGEFPRIDERFAGLSYRHGFYAASTDKELDSGFDMLAHLDLETGTRTAYQLPKGDFVSEPVFVPRGSMAREGDGYVLATVYRGAEKRSDLIVLDATALDRGPIATAELSHRVPFGFHGNWKQAG